MNKVILIIKKFLYRLYRKLYCICNISMQEDIVGGMGERQAAPFLDLIQKSHIARYEFASKFIKKGDKVLDIACGVGYGSYLIAIQNRCESITAVDIDKNAIEYARKYYCHPKIEYKIGDALNIKFGRNPFDKIISFETIEHLNDDYSLLCRFNKIITKQDYKDGLLIISTPNEKVVPYLPSKFIHHKHHYTPEQFEGILRDAGFKIIEKYSQIDSEIGSIYEGWNGKFLIAVARKAQESN